MVQQFKLIKKTYVLARYNAKCMVRWKETEKPTGKDKLNKSYLKDKIKANQNKKAN